MFCKFCSHLASLWKSRLSDVLFSSGCAPPERIPFMIWCLNYGNQSLTVVPDWANNLLAYHELAEAFRKVHVLRAAACVTSPCIRFFVTCCDREKVIQAAGCPDLSKWP